MIVQITVEPHISLSQISHCEENWYQFFTARKVLVPICHIFHTYISHFVKFAQVVKLYLAYMRKHHIDKNTPNLLHFAIDSNSLHSITWFNQIKLLKGHKKFCYQDIS